MQPASLKNMLHVHLHHSRGLMDDKGVIMILSLGYTPLLLERLEFRDL